MEIVLIGGEKDKFANQCPHFCEITFEAFRTRESTEEFRKTIFSLECYVCEGNIQPLWACIKSDCKKTFCSTPKPNHALCHYSKDSKHCVFENLLTSELWCFECKSRLSLEGPLPNFGEERVPGSIGLANLGNSSYMNAVLQALSHVPQVACFFLKGFKFLLSAFDTEDTEVGGVSPVFQELILDLWSSKSKSWVEPYRLHDAVRQYFPIFNCDIQHDSYEFLRCLLELLHEELKISSIDDTFKSNEILATETCNKSIISEVFKGCLVSSVKCLNCKTIEEQFQILSLPVPSEDYFKLPWCINTSHSQKWLHNEKMIDRKEEQFQILSLPVPSEEYFKLQWCINTSHNQKWLYNEDMGWFSLLLQRIRSVMVGPNVNLHDFLASFFSLDRLNEENKLNCNNCGKQSNGIKRFKLLTVPEVLCLHIKLFKDNISQDKYEVNIEFPLEGLEMRYYMKNDSPDCITRYTLVSIICHQNINANKDHFTCYCLNSANNQWYHYDDKQVTKVNREVVKKAQAYILFYRKEAVTKRRVMEKLSLLRNLSKYECKLYLISKKWLTRFSSFSEPGTIANDAKFCIHDKIKNRTEFVEITYSVWAYLQRTFGGGPVITIEDFCEVCYKDEISQVQARINKVFANDEYS